VTVCSNVSVVKIRTLGGGLRDFVCRLDRKEGLRPFTRSSPKKVFPFFYVVVVGAGAVPIFYAG